MAQILDLRPDAPKTGISFDLIRFPDHQRLLKIDSSTIDHEQNILVICSMPNGYGDIELMAMAKAGLQETGFNRRIFLAITYLSGARCDRAFELGGIRYLSQIIAPAINALKFDRVMVVDPHSDVAENVIDRMTKVPFEKLFYEQLFNFTRAMLVAPDAGASKKIYEVAKIIGNPNVLICGKSRDLATGKITKTAIPDFGSFEGEFLICDDLIDAGGTFLQLASLLNPLEAVQKLHLMATHAIFSDGFKFIELCENFDSITVSDSYRKLTTSEFETAKLSNCQLTQISFDSSFR